jgi:hypothetical protein
MSGRTLYHIFTISWAVPMMRNAGIDSPASSQEIYQAHQKGQQM